MRDYVIKPSTVHWFQAIPHWTMFVDPGPSTGYVIIHSFSPRVGHKYSEYYAAVSVPAERAQDRFAEFCLQAAKVGRTPQLVIEEYRIYPGKEAVHVGKEAETSEIIGGFTYIARRMKGRVFKTPAQVKQTTKGMCAGRGIYLAGMNEHQKDAELLMWYTAFRTESTKKFFNQEILQPRK